MTASTNDWAGIAKNVELSMCMKRLADSGHNFVLQIMHEHALRTIHLDGGHAFKCDHKLNKVTQRI